MKIVCLKCKNEDVEIRYERKFEEYISMVLPFAPYYCGECEKRWPNLIVPPFDKYRTIFAASLGGLLLLTILLSFLLGDDPEDESEKASATSTTQAPARPTIIDGMTDEEAIAIDEKALAEAPQSDLASGPPPGSVPAPGEVWSGTVHAQLERNLAVMRGEVVPETEPKKRKSRQQPPRSTPKPTDSATGTLNALTTSGDAAAFVLQVSAPAPINSYKGFAVGPNKYVVDLPGSWQVASSLGNLKTEHALVSGIRIGKHADKFRMVFDLNKSGKVTSAFKPNATGLEIRLSMP